MRQVDLGGDGLMVKFVAVAVLALSLSAVFSLGNAASRYVATNLNDPDALDMLKRSNPKHYAKVCEIMRCLFWRGDDAVPKWIQANFNAREVRYPPILLTSYPPKKRLSFTLDDARYEATVTLRKSVVNMSEVSDVAFRCDMNCGKSLYKELNSAHFLDGKY